MDLRQLMRVAYETATLSPDPSNQNGALIVQSDGIILTQSYNYIPRDSGVTQELIANRDWKIAHIAHAEEAAIIVAAREGIRISSQIMICPWAPCLSCARMIIIAGIRELVVHTHRMDTTPKHWQESINKAICWLINAGIEVTWINHTIPEAPKIIVNGEFWQP